MPDDIKRPGDVENFSGLNRLFKSKAVQYIINLIDDGTFRDFFGDWKWIFSFSRKYKWVIVFYTVLGIVSSSLSLLSSVISKYLVDIVTVDIAVNADATRLWILILAMVLSAVFSLVFSSLVSRYSTKLCSGQAFL
ncbi:MAG: hypothetical protein LUC39_01805 [Clostridiales bacterium]|nr:hypothetical protein [Clostridiales bacterium]